MSRLKRITDLFVEGTEMPLGIDDTGSPVVVWVNKLNSFETEEARRDGAARRGLRMAELGEEDNPERRGVVAEMALWSHDSLAERVVAQRADEIYLEAAQDLQTDPEQRERLDMITRLPQLLADAGAPPDDPRRAQLDEASEKWMQALHDAQEKATASELRQAKESEREKLEAAFLENWRQRQTMDVFMAERQVTQLYYALRECKAVDISTSVDQPRWDHSACDHTQRLMLDREEVHSLPDAVLTKAVEVLEDITMGARDAGFSDAPTSSSASLEQPRPAEESTPSTPAEASSELPMS